MEALENYQTEEQIEEQDYKAPKFEELVARFREKVKSIPEDCQGAIMFWLAAKKVQEARIRVENQLRQTLKVGIKVFWGDSDIPDSIKEIMLEAKMITEIEVKGKKEKVNRLEALRKQEDGLIRACEREFKKSRWYNEVAVPAAEGVGLGPALAGSLLWTIGDAKRFSSFGRLVRYAGLDVTTDGKAPKRSKGNRITWNPELRTALFKLTEGWNKMPESTWRAEWDGHKQVLVEKRPEILEEVNKEGKPCGKGHIHNMARRLIQRKFLRNLYHLWVEFEQ
ncbi:transposase [Pelotomaculum propionicicum]|uniref:Transposase IS116/IS110/IS902 C-terminal domain-containing protein n=1 Tax=Pelotomaculum propionicicum TaxID=258475 RepID=A0A4Y7RWV0_9FIRM|nr:transposase [Pelotomaculum propionicicum]TEB13381.1 hypothetical protein Pmgp_00275 [Pelotomaculum propionicicum]